MFNHNLLLTSDEHLTRLKWLYYNKWPNYADFLDEFSVYFSDPVFKEALNQFRIYIHERKNFHPGRYRRTYFLDGYRVSETKEFNQLNQEINFILHRTFYTTLIELINVLSEALSRALQYANENPVQIILLMLTTYYVVSAFGSVTENNRDPLQNLFDELEESDVHFKDVTSDITSCAQKKIGKNIGMTCSITQEDGTDTKYYLKKIHDNNAFKFYNNPLFSGYHQRFVQSVGLMTPTFEYHKIINFQNDYEYFLASKEVKGFKPANQISKDELHLLFSKNNNMAKFSVICTLLQDFHRQNYGFVDDQLVLIDLDMTARQGETQQDDFKNCCYGASREINKNVPNLTLEAVEKMIGIYQKLKTKKIPAFHPRFDMSNELYQALLSTYILACEDLVHDLKSMPAEELRNEMIMNKRYINLMLSYSFVSRANLLEEEFDKHPAIRELSCSIDRLKKP